MGSDVIKGSRATLLGGSGFVGRYLVQRLAKAGAMRRLPDDAELRRCLGRGRVERADKGRRPIAATEAVAKLEPANRRR